MRSVAYSGHPESLDRELDLGAVRTAIWRKKFWILLPVLLAALASLAVVQILTPKYKSEARILIEGRESIFLRPEAEKLGDRERAAIDQEAVTSQVQVVLSREVALRVIRDLKLTENSEFDPLLNGISPLKHILITIGLARDPTRMSNEERVLEAYSERLNAYSIDRSRVIAIEFQSRDPEVAAQAANAIADTYLSLTQANRQEQTRAAGTWLAGEVEKMRGKVGEAEARVEEFRSRSNLFVGLNNTTLSNQTLGDLNGQLAAARAQKTDAEAKARAIRDMLKTGGPMESELLNSDLIRRLSEQRVALRAQLAEQSSTLLPQHPRIKELRAQVADLDRQIRTEADKLARSLENDAQIAGSRLQMLTSNLDQVKTQASSINGQDVQLRALEREAKAQRELLESYLAKYREALARDSLGTMPGDARVISRAVVSNTPAFPKKAPIVLIATLATLFLSMGLVTVGQLLSSPRVVPMSSGRLDSSAEVLGAAQRELDSQQPLFRGVRPSLVASSDSDGEAIDRVAAIIAQGGGDANRIAMIGVARQVGVSRTAVALARRLGGRVLLLDLSFHHSLSERAATPGIAELVRGEATFTEIIHRDPQSRMNIVEAGQPHGDAATVLDSERVTIALNAFAQAYDFVVIDAGILGDIPPARLAKLAHRAVLVAGAQSEQEIFAAQEVLVGAGLEPVATLSGHMEDEPGLPAAAA